MNELEGLKKRSHLIEKKIGYSFKNPDLLYLAFIHRSFINENKAIVESHNERLEFLGDSVLNLLMAKHLYIHLPDVPEGDLSHLRSRLVEASSCAAFICKLDVEQYLLLGKGERMNDGRGRNTILADLLEAILGAMYLDGGISCAEKFLFRNFSQEIKDIIEKPARNWKAELQDFSQKKYQQAPIYCVISESGPDHSKEFYISVQLNQEEVGRGRGASKKEAQQAAAQEALQRMSFQT